MGMHPDDRRFRRILLHVLAICSVIGAIIPSIEVPRDEPEPAMDLPPRLVRIVADHGVPTVPPAPPRVPETGKATAVPQPEPSQPAVEAPAPAVGSATRKLPDTKPKPVNAEPQVSPREKAARAGVLAMSDALGELRGIAPKTTAPASASEAAIGSLATQTQKPNVLAAGMDQGSGGISGGVADQSVLGAAGLPGRSGSRGSGTSEGGEILAGTGGAPAPGPGRVRSEEEIQEILDRHKSAMYKLYNRALRRDSTLQGKLVMNITIAPSGRVMSCTIMESDLNAVSLETQLIQLVKGIDFGNKPGVAVVATKVPIEFFPR